VLDVEDGSSGSLSCTVGRVLHRHGLAFVEFEQTVLVLDFFIRVDHFTAHVLLNHGLQITVLCKQSAIHYVVRNVYYLQHSGGGLGG